MEAGSAGTKRLEKRDQYRMLIGGQLVDAVNGRRLETASPFAAGPLWAEVAYDDAEDVNITVRAAKGVFEGPWAR